MQPRITRAGEPNWHQIGSLTVTRFESSISGARRRVTMDLLEYLRLRWQSMQINQDIQFAGSDKK
jgi:hypothetical protein